MIVGLVVGSGIFRTPASVAQAVDSVWIIAALWLAGGLVTLCLALCLAELATSFPDPGGIYVYLREAYGPSVAFVFGWTVLLLNPAVSAAMALIFAGYLGQFLALSGNGERGAATAVILFVTAVNYFSVKFAVRIQNAVISAKAFSLLALTGVVFAFGDGTTGAFAQQQPPEQPAMLGGLVGAFLAVLFSYEGVAGSCAVFGEVRDPGRNLPRALLTGVVAVIVLYLLVNAAYLYVLPLDRVASSPLVAAEAVQAVTGPRGAAVIAVCVMLSAFGTLAGTAIANPRVFYAMARDGLFFRSVGAVHPRYRTPYLAVTVSGAVASVYVWMRSFEELIAQFMLGLWPFLALTILGLMLLRRRRPDPARPFRTPGYPLVPLIFLVVAIGVLVTAFIELPSISLANLAVLLLGLVAYLIWKRSRS